MPTKPVPEGYSTLTAYLAVDDAAAAIDDYTRAFGAEERVRTHGPDGKVGHASPDRGLQVDAFGSNPAVLDDTAEGDRRHECERLHVCRECRRGRRESGRSGGNGHDGGRRINSGADRFGTITDPFGHVWSIATHVEDLTPGEIEERGGLRRDERRLALRGAAGSGRRLSRRRGPHSRCEPDRVGSRVNRHGRGVAGHFLGGYRVSGRVRRMS